MTARNGDILTETQDFLDGNVNPTSDFTFPMKATITVVVHENGAVSMVAFAGEDMTAAQKAAYLVEAALGTLDESKRTWHVREFPDA